MRVTPNTYLVGAIPRLKATFTDLNGDLADPTVIVFHILEPDTGATVTQYTFGVNVELVRDSEGVYYVDWIIEHAGEHCYRFVGTGDVRAVAERHFDVEAGCFAT